MEDKVDIGRLKQHVLRSDLTAMEKTYLEMLIDTRESILAYQQGFIKGIVRRDKEFSKISSGKWISVHDKDAAMKFPCIAVDNNRNVGLIAEIYCVYIEGEFRIYSGFYKTIFESYAQGHNMECLKTIPYLTHWLPIPEPPH